MLFNIIEVWRFIWKQRFWF